MTYSPLLGPIVALVAWSILILFWMVIVRLPAMKKAGIDLNTRVGSTPGALDGAIDAKAQWKAHNYIHLMEQPTIFYAIVFALILIGDVGPLCCWLAWGYVGLRIVHSLVQATVNIVLYRFSLFLLSSLCLVGLTIIAAARLL